MQSVISTSTQLFRLLGLGLAAATLVAATTAATTQFQAASPGSELELVGGTGALVEVVQGQETVLWTALAGTVSNITTLGWPTSDGIHELGGALTIERPANGQAGIVDFGDRPMSMRFDLSR